MDRIECDCDAATPCPQGRIGHQVKCEIWKRPAEAGCSCPVCTTERAGHAAQARFDAAREVLTNQLEIARRQRRVLELQLLEVQSEKRRVERLFLAALALIEPEHVSKLALCPKEVERWK